VDRNRLVAAIDRLAVQPHAGDLPKGEFAGLRRLRVGRYQIVYEALDKALTVLVVRIGRLRDMYR